MRDLLGSTVFDSALSRARVGTAGLGVHADRMRANRGLTGGLTVAQAVMMAAPALGRQRAHGLVCEACREAIEGGGALATILAASPAVAEALGGGAAIRRRCDRANCLGSCGAMVDPVLGDPDGRTS